MAAGKKSFVLYADQIHVFEGLSPQEAGELIVHIFRYVNDITPDVPHTNRIVEIAFTPIKHQMKRDLKAWEAELTGKSAGGRKGMQNRWKSKKTITGDNIVSDVITPVTPITVNVNDNVNVNVTDNVKDINVPEIIIPLKKEAKKREKKEFVAPAIEEMIEYFKQNGFPKELAERAWKGYDAADWHDTKGNKVRNWKQKSQNVWFKEENKSKIEVTTQGYGTDFRGNKT